MSQSNTFNQEDEDELVRSLFPEEFHNSYDSDINNSIIMWYRSLNDNDKDVYRDLYSLYRGHYEPDDVSILYRNIDNVFAYLREECNKSKTEALNYIDKCHLHYWNYLVTNNPDDRDIIGIRDYIQISIQELI